MAGKKKYTRQALTEAIKDYFDEITCEVYARDANGEKLKNVKGNFILRTVYAVPPTVAGLCVRLGIDRSTWQNYCNRELSPRLYDVCEKAKEKMERYLEEQLITRERSVQGIIFNLQNNYGWKQRGEIEIGAETRESMESVGLSEKLAMIKRATEKMEEAHERG